MSPESPNQAALAPLIVHQLPRAPSFAGRENELEELKRFWDGTGGVLSISGVGGSGKTALIEQFVRKHLRTDKPDGLLVWSFYDDPDVNAFLATAHDYFTGGDGTVARGAGWFHLLREALAQRGRSLIILDGLERVQQTATDSTGLFGQLEDPLLRGLLRRLVSAPGACKVIITSRFPIADLERRLGDGYSTLSVDRLSPEAALTLMAHQGVDRKGADRLISAYGLHALTLDLVAGATRLFFGGDADKMPVPEIDESGKANTAANLAAILGLFQERLQSQELDILVRLCVFRFGVTAVTLAAIFGSSENPAIGGSLAGMSEVQLADLMKGLIEAHLIHLDDAGVYTLHPAVRDHFYRLFRDAHSAHEAVSAHFLSLTGRPGIGLPTDKAALDLLEELIHHSLRAGRPDEAGYVYLDRMGGNDHLNTKLGEYTRTHRILSAFEQCPDRSGMYHSLRAFGRFEDALVWRPQNRYIRVLLGKLTELAQDPSEATQRVAMHLQGEAVSLPSRFPDLPVPPAMLILHRGTPDEAELAATRELSMTLYQDDSVRHKMALAEVQRIKGKPADARRLLEEVTPWVLSSASAEHLCLLYMLRGRLANDEGRLGDAVSSVEEARQITEDCEFALWGVDVASEACRCDLADGDAERALAGARQAAQLALDPAMRYAWGFLRAQEETVRALVALGRRDEAIEAARELASYAKRCGSARSRPMESALHILEGSGRWELARNG